MDPRTQAWIDAQPRPVLSAEAAAAVAQVMDDHDRRVAAEREDAA